MNYLACQPTLASTSVTHYPSYHIQTTAFYRQCIVFIGVCTIIMLAGFVSGRTSVIYASCENYL